MVTETPGSADQDRMTDSAARRPYCPCGGTCHFAESPCSFGCMAHNADVRHRSDDDSAETVWVDVTNPDGVTFPAVLGKFHKAGVVTFFVLPEDCPPGEVPYERCEWTKPRPTLCGGDPTTRVYRVRRRA